MNTFAHPDRSELAALLLGELSAESEASVSSHVDVCPDCQSLVETLDTLEDTFVAKLRKSASVEQLEISPACAGVLRLAVDFPVGTADSIGSGNQPPKAELPPVILDYQLGEPIGQGGMGTVYKALQTHLDKIVAIKVLPSDRLQDPSAVARFRREIRAVGKLDHPNLVRALNAGEVEGRYYLAMEFVDGLDLSRLVNRLGPLPIPAACELIRQAALGLQHAHEHGMVHRDIKPGNIMLSQQGTVKVLDLGLALLPQQEVHELTSTGNVMGTLDYMPPEQGGDSHHVDIRADIYSLGATFFKLLTGHAIYHGRQYTTPVQKITAIATEEAPAIQSRRPDVPANLAAIVHRMIAKNPADRFATPAEVAVALAPFTAQANLTQLVKRYREQEVSGIRLEASIATDHYLSAPGTGTNASLVPATEAFYPSTAHPVALGDSGRNRPLTWFLASAGGIALILAGIFVIIRNREGKEVGRFEVPVQGSVVIESSDKIQKAPPTTEEKPQPLSPQNELKSVAPQSSVIPENIAAKPPTGTETSAETNPLPLKLGPALPTPELVKLNLNPEPITISAGSPLQKLPLVTQPAELPGVLSWNIALRQPLGYVTLALSPNGNTLASGSSGDGIVRFWDTKTRKLVKMFLHPELQEIVGLCWSPCGTYLAVATQTETVQVWNVQACARVRRFRGCGTNSLAWSPNGKYFAFGGCDRKEDIGIWNAAEDSPVLVLRGHKREIWSMAWSPDGQRLATGSIDQTACIWEIPFEDPIALSKLAPRFTLPAAKHGRVESLLWSRDGAYLLTVDTHRQGMGCSVWQAATGKLVISQTEHAYNKVASSRNGKYFIDERGNMFDWETQQKIWGEISNNAVRCEFSADGRAVNVGSSWGFLSEVDISTRTVNHFTSGHSSLSCNQWCSSDVLFSKYDNGPYYGRRFATWSLREGKLLQFSPKLDPGFHAAFLAPDGNMVAAVRGGTIQLWDRQSMQLRESFDASQGTRSLAWSPDGKQLASIHEDRKLRVWKVGNKAVEKELELDKLSKIPEHPGMAWSPNGKYLAIEHEAMERGSTRIILETNSWNIVLQHTCGDWGKLPVWSDDSELVGVERTIYRISDKKVFDADYIGGVIGSDYICRDRLIIWKWDLIRGTRIPIKTTNFINCGSTAPLQRYENHIAIGTDHGMTTIYHTTWEQILTLIPLPNEQGVAISADGHYRADGDVTGELFYVVQTAEGQDTYTPAEFAAKFNWKNDPSRVKLLKK